jgi:hypothetical protein
LCDGAVDDERVSVLGPRGVEDPAKETLMISGRDNIGHLAYSAGVNAQ